MAKSKEIPIHRDFDNPFNDQTAFSPPQTHHILDREPGMLGGGGVAKFEETFGGRERSASQPVSEHLRNPSNAHFHPSPLRRGSDDRGNSNPNLTESQSPHVILPPTSGLHPIDRALSTPIKDAVQAEGIRGFYSAPVTPCQTPIGSRQGSPKAERKKTGGLLGAIFGAGIYGRGISEGGTAKILGHLTEDNEDDFTPVGSPNTFTIDELKTRLRGVDEEIGSGRGGSLFTPNTPSNTGFQFPARQADAAEVEAVAAPINKVKSKSKKRKEREAELIESYRELTISTPSSM